jgi:hypothetical protein
MQQDESNQNPLISSLHIFLLGLAVIFASLCIPTFAITSLQTP